MRGLVFDLSIPKYVVAKAVGKQFPRVHYGRGSCLSVKELPPPALPGPGWVRLKTVLAGFCGSDLATVFFKASPQLEPFNSFPAVLGHEILAEVSELPAPVAGLEVGQRVVVNPLLPCRLRGLTPCRACAGGMENGCENTAEGHLAPGQMIGYHRDLPGGMGTELVAHSSQLHPVGHEVKDEAAVLIEPLAVCLHAVLRHPPKDEDRVLIIGGGPVAFATLWAIRALGLKAHVTLLTFEGYQLERARAFGADDTLKAIPSDLEEAREVVRRTSGHVYTPVIGPPAMTGGYDLVFDCAGNQASVQDSLRYTRAFGKIVLIGAAGILDAVDWTAIWHNELTVVGSYVYGPESFRGRRIHTFDLVQELLAKGEGPDPAPLVTHRFRLAQYREAIEANVRRAAHESIKTVFDLRGER